MKISKSLIQNALIILLAMNHAIHATAADQVIPGTGLEAVSALTLPTVDISGEHERLVVIAQGTPEIYEGHADTVLLADGKTMFCVWTLNHGWGEPYMKRSEDGGLTWRYVPVPENWNDTWNTHTSRPGSTRGGRARGWLPMIHHLPGPDGEGLLVIFDRGKDNKMIQSVSKDLGETWSPMRQTDLHGIEPSMNIIASKDGKRLMMWSTVRSTVFQSESFDGGLTWERERGVIDMDELPGVQMIEPGVVRSPDGEQLLMLIRDIQRSRKFNALYSVSDDDGETWSRPRRLSGELTGERHAPLYLPDGRLMIAMRDTLRNGTTPTLSHFIAWVGHYEDIIEGRPGQYRIKLMHSFGGWDNAYPSLQLLPDGTVVATTYIKYDEGPNHQSVVSTRFKIEEIDAMLAEGRSVLQPIAPPEPLRSEGVTLLTGPMAVLSPVQGEMRKPELGARIFSNRNHAFHSLPDSLAGHSFLYSPIEETEAVVSEAGLVYVLTPRSDRNERGSLEGKLLEQGFQLANVREFELFPNLSNAVSIFQKQVQAGERISFGLWGVLIGK